MFFRKFTDRRLPVKTLTRASWVFLIGITLIIGSMIHFDLSFSELLYGERNTIEPTALGLFCLGITLTSFVLIMAAWLVFKKYWSKLWIS